MSNFPKRNKQKRWFVFLFIFFMCQFVLILIVLILYPFSFHIFWLYFNWLSLSLGGKINEVLLSVLFIRWVFDCCQKIFLGFMFGDWVSWRYAFIRRKWCMWPSLKGPIICKNHFSHSRKVHLSFPSPLFRKCMLKHSSGNYPTTSQVLVPPLWLHNLGPLRFGP